MKKKSIQNRLLQQIGKSWRIFYVLFFLFFSSVPLSAEENKTENSVLSPEEAYRLLVAGNARYIKQLKEGELTLRELSSSDDRFPIATILYSSDLAVKPNILTDLRERDLYTLPVKLGAFAKTDLPDFEYGIMNLRTPVALVLTHYPSAEILESIKEFDNLEAEAKVQTKKTFSTEDASKIKLSANQELYNLIGPAIKRSREAYPNLQGEELANVVCEALAWQSLESILLQSNAAAALVKEGSLDLMAAIVDDASGRIYWLGAHPLQEEFLKPAPKEVQETIQKIQKAPESVKLEDLPETIDEVVVDNYLNEYQNNVYYNNVVTEYYEDPYYYTPCWSLFRPRYWCYRPWIGINIRPFIPFPSYYPWGPPPHFSWWTGHNTWWCGFNYFGPAIHFGPDFRPRDPWWHRPFYVDHPRPFPGHGPIGMPGHSFGPGNVPRHGLFFGPDGRPGPGHVGPGNDKRPGPGHVGPGNDKRPGPGHVGPGNDKRPGPGHVGPGNDKRPGPGHVGPGNDKRPGPGHVGPGNDKRPGPGHVGPGNDKRPGGPGASNFGPDNRPGGPRPGNVEPGKRPEGQGSSVTPGNRPGQSSGLKPVKPAGQGSSVTPGNRPGQSSGLKPVKPAGQGSSATPGNRPGRSSGLKPVKPAGQGFSATPGNRPGQSSGLKPVKPAGQGSSATPGNRPGQSSKATPGNRPTYRPGQGSNAVPGTRPGGTFSDILRSNGPISTGINSRNGSSIGTTLRPGIEPSSTRSGLQSADSQGLNTTSRNSQSLREGRQQPTFGGLSGTNRTIDGGRNININRSGSGMSRAGSSPVRPDSSTINRSGSSPVRPGSSTINRAGSSPVRPDSSTINRAGSSPVRPGSSTINRSGSSPVRPGSSTINRSGSSPVRPGSSTINRSGSSPVRPGSSTINRSGFSPVRPGSSTINRSGFSSVRTPSVSRPSYQPSRSSRMSRPSVGNSRRPSISSGALRNVAPRR